MDAALVIVFCLFLVESNESGVLFRHALPAPLSITRHSTGRLLQRGVPLIHSSSESMGVKMAQAIWSVRRRSQLESARNSHPASPRSAASSRELPTKISVASLVNHRGGTNHPVR